MSRRRFLFGRRNSPLDRLTAHEFQFGDAHVRVYEEWTMRPELASCTSNDASPATGATSAEKNS